MTPDDLLMTPDDLGCRIGLPVRRSPLDGLLMTPDDLLMTPDDLLMTPDDLGCRIGRLELSRRGNMIAS